ncbi:hypothetical protein [Clostridium sp. C2-6-12]|uniref:hypothetical protein n=1 Tax=Clostridium TaxID=1485 RepID=UPI001371C588|nr:hypothetical protein [Clostridium sp. C2-6-12]MDU4658575.1 hypothetical protein [Clostridium butyricum]
MDWWNVSVFIVIPILAVVFLFCFKRKHLWSAPVISTILTVVISLIAMPAILEDGEAYNMFFKLVLPIHFAIALVLTSVAYGISFILKNKHRS